MKLAVISSPAFFAEEARIIERLFAEGLELFHLRKPGAEEDELSGLISQIDPLLHRRISMHSNYHLALKYRLGGVHLTEKKWSNCGVDTTEQDPVVSADIRLSASVHCFADCRLRREYFGRKLDYIFLSPIFDSISKPDYKSAFSHEDLKDFLETNSDLADIFALGGISAENILFIRHLGFAGAVLHGVVWKTGDAVTIFKDIKRILSNETDSTQCCGL